MTSYMYVAYQCNAEVTLVSGDWPVCADSNGGWQMLGPDSVIPSDVLQHSFGGGFFPGLSVSQFEVLAVPIALVFASAWGWQQLSKLIVSKGG